MGLFLALNSVVGKPAAAVADSLARFAQQSGGGLEVLSHAAAAGDNCCILEENGNTTILFPDHFMQWDDAAAFISEDLQAPVFSFHIHDSDLWMYIFYVNGTDEDQFNPVPEYWDDSISDDERDYWEGDADTLAIYMPHINSADIEKYLVHWDEDMDMDTATKAYPDDKAGYADDEQLFDFMRKLQLPIPFNDNFKPTGACYKLWTEEKPAAPGDNYSTSIPETNEKKKPWWKFW